MGTEHELLIWNDFGDNWICNACGKHGSNFPGDLPNDYTCNERNELMTEVLTDKQMDDLDTEEEFLANYDLKKYPAQALTADLAIFTIRDERLCVLLIKRGGHPEKGKWALPGGFVNVDESVDQAAARELMEETNIALDETHLEQLKTYARPGRDPRGYIVSCTYVALVPKAQDPVAGDDAKEAKFFPVSEVLASFDLAFDHDDAIRDGLARVRAKLEYAPLAHKFLDSAVFTIPELRRVYEIVWGEEAVPANFRRKVLSVPGFLSPVDQKRSSSIPGGRLAELYQAGDIDTIYPPFRRVDF